MAVHVSFQTDPSRYRHWRYDRDGDAIAGALATVVTMAADGGLVDSYELTFPHRRGNRQIGHFAVHHVSFDGRMVSESDCNAQRNNRLPSETDLEFVATPMHPVTELGKVVAWIAPPRSGINVKPIEYEYVHLDD